MRGCVGAAEWTRKLPNRWCIKRENYFSFVRKTLFDIDYTNQRRWEGIMSTLTSHWQPKGEDSGKTESTRENDLMKMTTFPQMETDPNDHKNCEIVLPLDHTTGKNKTKNSLRWQSTEARRASNVPRSHTGWTTQPPKTHWNDSHEDHRQNKHHPEANSIILEIICKTH